MQAAIAGHYGIPFVFLSGDHWACREIRRLCKGCVAVPVKRGLSTFSARTFAPRKAQELIRAGAEKALAAADKVQPFRLDSPVHYRCEMKEPVYDSENPPDGFTVLDSHTVEMTAKDIIDLFIKLYRYPPDFQPRKKPKGNKAAKR
jgi:D-amino peptidase